MTAAKASYRLTQWVDASRLWSFELVTYTSHLTSPKHLLCTGRRVRPRDAQVILAQFSLWVDEKAASTDGREKA